MEPPIYSFVLEAWRTRIPAQQAGQNQCLFEIWREALAQAQETASHTQLQPDIFQLKRRSAWEILFNLTCFSRAPFEEMKRLRSDRYAPDEIYSLIRLSNSLEEPGKTRATGKRYSQCASAGICPGPVQQFTADPNFGSESSRWIRRQVLCHKHILIPFHLPVFNAREQPHQSLKDFLHNFKDWDAWLQHNSLERVPCPPPQVSPHATRGVYHPGPCGHRHRAPWSSAPVL